MRRILSILRLLLIAVVVASIVVGVWIWIDNLKREPAARLAVGFLITLQALYVMLWAALIPGIPWLIRRLLRARSERRSDPRAAKALLLCFSLLFAALTGEAVAAIIGEKLVPEFVKIRPTTFNQTEATDKRTVSEMIGRTAPVQFPAEYPDKSDPDAVDIVVVGESSASGIPFGEWNYSPGEYIRRRLSEWIPNRKFRDFKLAVSGDTLRGQLLKFARMDRRPELVVIYCGHNEFSAIYHWDRGPRHYDDGDDPTPFERVLLGVERVSPLFAMMKRIENHRRVAIPPTRGSQRALVDVPVYTPEEYRTILEDFATRLDQLVAHSVSIGALPILLIPPANDAGFEPNRSFLPPKTTRAEREAFARDFLQARAMEESNPSETLKRYQALLSRGSTFAELHFRIGRLLEKEGKRDEAARSYALARDLDGLPQRLPSDFQNVYRAVAKKNGCPLIDGPALLRSISETGQLDEKLFQDAMHPSLRGHCGLVQGVLAELHRRRAFGMPEKTPPPSVVPDAVAAEFGIDREAWRKLCHWSAVFYQLTEPLRYESSFRKGRELLLIELTRRIEAGEDPNSLGFPGIGHAVPFPPFPVNP